MPDSAARAHEAPAEAAVPELPLRRMLLALALGSMLTPLNSTMVSVLLGDIGTAFSHPVTGLMPALVTSYLVVSIVMQAPAGKLGDRLGHLRLVRVGLVVFAFGSLVAAFAQSVGPLALGRVIMAAGGTLVIPSATATIRLYVPLERRAATYGTFGAGMALSAASGPIVGPLVASASRSLGPYLPTELHHLLGYPATFLLNLAIIPLALVLLPSPPPRVTDQGPLRFDWGGSLLLGLGLASLVVGANHLEDRLIGPACLAASLALLAAFFVWERRQPEPIVDLALAVKPVFLAGGAITGLQNLAMYAVLFELPMALAGTPGFTPASRGSLLSSMMAAMVLVSPISGRLADRIGPRRVAVVGSLLAVSGLLLIYRAGLVGVAQLVPGLVCFGLGLGLSAAPSQSAAMAASPPESSGVASAMLSVMRYLGGVIGTVTLAVVYSNAEDPAVRLAEHHRALGVFGISLSLAVCCAFLLPMRNVETPSGAGRGR